MQRSSVNPFVTTEDLEVKTEGKVGHIEEKIKLLRLGNKSIQVSALLLLIVILLIQGKTNIASNFFIW